ncbi:MAG: H+transporting two-sector ATPase C subunit [Planctomycetes bacterium]|nr:H+transporting two-sector ATPase C subunit [Planctomycetota bacterium]
MLSRWKVMHGVVCLLMLAVLTVGVVGVVFAEGDAGAKEPISRIDKAVGLASAAAVMCFGLAAAGYAVAKVGAAAMGACAEKPELLGRALIFVAIGEGIAVFGLIVAVLMLRQL